MKNFGLNCDQCGERHMVTTNQAGSTISCSCGGEVVVPPLSELRKSEGLDAYEMPISEKVLQLVFDDKLPTRRDCVRCGDSRAEKQHAVAVCERSHQQTAGGGAVAGVIMGVPFYVPLPGSPTGQQVGRNIVVPLVFNICSTCWMRSRGRGQLPALLRAITVVLTILASASIGIWLFRPDLVDTQFILTSAVICVVGAVLTFGAALSASTPALSKLRKGLCKESVYRELFKQYPDAEVFELKPREEA